MTDRRFREMSFLDHLGELRKRLTRSAVAVGISFLICWYFIVPIFKFLARPIEPYLENGMSDLAFTDMTEPFFVYMKVALVAGLFFASPYVFVQLWGFLSPGLYRKEKRLVFPFVFFTVGFFVGGCSFGYWVAFPFMCDFFMKMGEDFFAIITLTKYVSLLVKVLLGLGLVFEMPVLIFFLAKLGIVDSAFLIRWFRHAVVIIVIIAAIITPTPDVATLLVFSAPMVVLYMIGIVVAWMVGKGDRSKSED